MVLYFYMLQFSSVYVCTNVHVYICVYTHISLLPHIAPVSAPCPSKHQVNYVTSHKGPCLTAAFSRDGKLAASGSADSSIKVHWLVIYKKLCLKLGLICM